MESITKNRQSPSTLKKMIAKAYGEHMVPTAEDFWEELGHGWFNVAYDIYLEDGRHVVLKIAPPKGVAVMSYERAMMTNELAAMALVESESSVPIPQVDFADTTHQLVDADWFFMPFVEADNFGVIANQGRIGPNERSAFFEQLGALNRELNRIPGQKFGPVRNPTFDSWREYFLAMIEDTLNDGERIGVDIGWDYDFVRGVVYDRAHLFDAVVEPRYCELDLWDSNAMYRDGQIVSLIDHERAMFGDPLIEAGFVALDLPEFGDAEAFTRGYRLPALTKEEAERRRLYTLSLILTMIIETKYRGHTDTLQYDQSRTNLDRILAQLGYARKESC